MKTGYARYRFTRERLDSHVRRERKERKGEREESANEQLTVPRMPAKRAVGHTIDCHAMQLVRASATSRSFQQKSKQRDDR